MASYGALQLFRLLLSFLLIWQAAYMADATTDVPKDCSEVVAPESSTEEDADDTPEDGLYVLRPTGSQAFSALCQFDEDGSWTIIQNNVGSGDWDRTWDEYRNGFGELENTKNYWLGLEKIHWLTSQTDRVFELRVDLTTAAGDTKALYESFSVADEANNYFLSYGDFESTSTATDGLSTTSRNRQFSTKSKDNDGSTTKNCADLNRGGWWYYGDDCSAGILNKATVEWPGEDAYTKAVMRIRVV